MHRALLLVLMLGLVQAGRAAGGERNAMVAGSTLASGQPACAQRLEAVLKRHGYRVVDQSFPVDKVQLMVTSMGDCRRSRDLQYRCSTRAIVRDQALMAFELYATGRAYGSASPAMDEACRDLAEQLEYRLAGKPDPTLPGVGERSEDEREMTALVVENICQHNWNRQAVCGQRVETVVREAGYRLLDRTAPRSKARLLIDLNSSCWGSEERRFHCRASADVRLPRSFFEVEGHGSSLGSRSYALDEACRNLARRLRERLWSESARPAEVDGRPVPRTHYELLVSWEGEIDPLPLLPMSRFFEKAGYRAELVESKSGEYLYALDLDQPPERFHFLLDTFLQHHYEVVCGFAAENRLACRLTTRAEESKP